MIDTNDGVFKPTPKEFCEYCDKAVRKLDLDGNNRAVPGTNKAILMILKLIKVGLLVLFSW